ncbi:BglG family transcriptional antiterminator [Lachnotalea glycerini]|uniref:BglG family transcriptional antiterminator n=1 Tax=Lachnotalea glycerini TaxID=1763509 RepID=A0A318EK79_9FIRM|nr:PRD domain-containing protein [Lachnotalea glycerini]PXV89040.1 BglG family transcriptional antiterminator [Lachnotalea glycerini]RDY31512.1 PRD domain-containing protein [Lachnotalea glycerini]
MKIEKIINNNIVSAYDENNREIVVMGRGLGFGRKLGDMIDDIKIEKIFRMDNEAESERLQSVLADIPLEHIQISNDIITYSKTVISKKLNKNIYITLTDHINFAIDRYKQGLNFKNALLWEIKKFYSAEYEVGKKALEMIKETLGIELPDDEAASIAMHLVNAEFGTDMPNTIDITKLIQNVLKIIKYYYQVELDEESINYERFITHLKFFAQRIITHRPNSGTDEEFHNMIKSQYKTDYRCAEKIRKYIENEFKMNVPEEELIYLTVHLRRITTAN